MPDLSVLIQMAEFYGVEIKEILDGERKSEIMDKELKETLSMVADYNKLEKKKVEKAGNIYGCISCLLHTLRSKNVSDGAYFDFILYWNRDSRV